MLPINDELIWFPERGYGYYPVTVGAAPYDEAYFEKYVGYENTEIGRRINEFRVGLARKHCDCVIDVGIGSGTFVAAHGNALGYDINPAGVRWLKDRGVFADPYDGCDAVTCWDSLEHIPYPTELLSRVREKVIVSIPIFDNAEHVLKSKHFRKDEHFWYFTRQGFINFMAKAGFRVIEHSLMETLLGRDGIETFVFTRSKESR